MIGYEAGRISGVLMTSRQAYEMGHEAGRAAEEYRGSEKTAA